MEKFCTNCGHSNNSTNQICVECGTSLTKEPKQASAPQGPKKPLPFKTKLLAGIAIVLLASIIGLYTWGTQTASAETAVSKFFEALQEKDAATLSKYAVLSTGEELTEKEASAFIDLYQNITPIELEEMATVEKNGKFAGIFDAHKVILTPQQVSFYFPYDGLNLNLNGESVEAMQNADGEYVFSGIAPGNYEAEFAFDDGETVFAHLFDLTVEYQEDTSYVTTIEEDLPIGSTVFQVTVAEYSPSYTTKIVIGEKEYPVDESGSTEDIGPFLLDGSMNVQAKVEFPWGAVTSDAVPIDGEYINIDIAKLDKKTEGKLIDQFAAFLEEDIKAAGTRDASVYTSLTPGKLKEVTDTLDSWKENEYFFKGSLTKINFDGESVQLLSDGVSVTGEVVIEGAYYYQSEKPVVETEKYPLYAKFIYDSEKKKWLVEDFDQDNYYDGDFTVEPLQTVEGSKKVYEVKGSTDAVKETSSESVSSDDQAMEIEDFMNQYNSLSVMAMNSGDFSHVSYLISEDGPKYQESADYVDYVYSKGITEEHLGTSLEKVEKIDANQVKVTTIDRFIIHKEGDSSEKEYRSVTILISDGDGWLVKELVSTKEI
ncbi:hypothetical protein [Planomicrobium sp. CPCC 101110]|uniref:TcaA NTF2-like domain-containing protein n=1 Tax=Planomicrobium sp. CPCC 101110 TaxID=2599619 RepID=UPI0011B67292|nr:hypothetical protein [Planomicrobium sp. CPCC 101110]TWT27738.1 hypothetical protein FQV30_04290 [Planomicrobium sp. CPCC 101110]